MKTSSIVAATFFSAISLSSAFAQWSNDPLVNTQISFGGGVNANSDEPNIVQRTPITSVIASDGKGGAIFIYSVLDSASISGSIYAQRVDASGNLMWGTNGVAFSRHGFQYMDHIISDGAGGAFVTWSEIDSSYDKKGNLFRSADVYAQRIDASGSTRWNQKGVPVRTGNNGQNALDIVSDGADGVFISSVDARDEGIYLQRVGPSGDMLWINNGVYIDSFSIGAGGTGQVGKILSDGIGGAIINYAEIDSMVNGIADINIYAQRLNSAGGKLWTPNRVVVCTATGPRYNPVMISDGANGAIIAWEDGRIYGNYDIFAQRIDGSGKSLWAANGINVCSAKYNQTYTAMVSDGNGGAFIAWADHRDGFSNNIFAERIDKSGASLWTPNGVAIFKAPNYLASNSFLVVSMTGDGAGGVIMAWADARNDGPNFRNLNNDIFAQRINADSTIGWKPNGVAVSTAAGNQFNPVVVSSGGGSAIVTWNDSRNAPTQNIFAQRINNLGVLGSGSSIATPLPTYPPNGTLLTDTTVTLRWGKINGAIAYQLQCGTDPTFNTQLVVDLSNLTDTMHLITVLQRSSTYYWRVRALGQIAHHKDNQIQSTPGDWSSVNNFKTPGAGNSVSENKVNEFAFELYPNPAVNYASITYILDKRSSVKIDMLNTLGQTVSMLCDYAENPGSHTLHFDTQIFPEGNYFIRFTAGSMQIVKKLEIVH